MKKLKKLIVSLLFTKRQKVAIWNALCYSNHVYRKRNDVDNASCTKIVMDELQYVLGAENAKYSGKEVKDMLEEAVSKVTERFAKESEENCKKVYDLGIVDGQKLAFKRLEEQGVIEIVHSDNNNIGFVPAGNKEEKEEEKPETVDDPKLPEKEEEKPETSENNETKEEVKE